MQRFSVAMISAVLLTTAPFAASADPAANLDAMAKLGEAYLRGDGVPQDREKATELFQRAAAAGHPAALYALASLRLATAAPGDARGRACGYLKAAQDRGATAAPDVAEACADLSAEERHWADSIAAHVPLLKRPDARPDAQ